MKSVSEKQSMWSSKTYEHVLGKVSGLVCRLLRFLQFMEVKGNRPNLGL